MSTIHIDRLKPHPKNAEYFADLGGDKYEELKRSIATNGIRDPLKILPDGTILAGHQRYRIARELGIQQVPVAIYDVSPEEAEYLLIADNEERRGEDNDPMRKARRAKFLAEYWGVQRGGDRRSKDQIGLLKTLDDIADSLGESKTNTKRLIKLNDLIPELQALVSSGKLGTTAAEQLAYLSPDIQRALYEALGDEIASRTVAETKELRRRLEEAERRDQEMSRLREELIELRNRGRDEDRSRIAELEARIRDLQGQTARLAELERELAFVKSRGRDEDRARIEELERQIEELRNRPVEYVEVIPSAVIDEIETWKQRAAELERKLKSTEELVNQHAERVAKLFDEVVRLKSGGAVVEMPKRRDDDFNVSEWAKQYFRFMGDTSFLLKANPERMDALVEHLLQKRNTDILLLDLQMLERVAAFAEYMHKRLSERLHKPQLIKG